MSGIMELIDETMFEVVAREPRFRLPALQRLATKRPECCA